MFRLHGLEFPSIGNLKPQYFGYLTNNVIYTRLAPDVLKELKEKVPRKDLGKPTTKFFQQLTRNTG